MAIAAASAARRSSTRRGLASARIPPVEVATRLPPEEEFELEEVVTRAFSTLDSMAAGFASGCAASIVLRTLAAASSLELSPKWTA